MATHLHTLCMYNRRLLQKYGDGSPITELYMIYVYSILCELGIAFDCKASNKQIRIKNGKVPVFI
jgi:hypothetical protein